MKKFNFKFILIKERHKMSQIVAGSFLIINLIELITNVNKIQEQDYR